MSKEINLSVDFYAEGFRHVDLIVNPYLKKVSDAQRREIITRYICQLLMVKGIKPKKSNYWRPQRVVFESDHKGNVVYDETEVGDGTVSIIRAKIVST